MTRYTVLLADDDLIIHRVVRRALSDATYRILSAWDGANALRLAEDERPDLILLDIKMPEKDGLEVIKNLRQTRITKTIPVLMLTANGDVDNKANGLDLGADDYITKPFESRELVARVAGALRRSKRDLSANPLTHLPGSPAIEEAVARKISTGELFAFYYLDIDHFKSYNDSYGYAQGDRVIRAVAESLQEALAPLGDANFFLGHIGGDDFVMITHPRHTERLASGITARFDEIAPGFYNPDDWKNRCVPLKDRLGRSRRFPLLSLSIAMVTNERRRLEHYAQVVDIAAEIKRYLKSRPSRQGSVYLKDRRRVDAAVKQEPGGSKR